MQPVVCDGWVSLEVSPKLAHDSRSTIAEAKALHEKAATPEPVHQGPGHARGSPRDRGARSSPGCPSTSRSCSHASTTPPRPTHTCAASSDARTPASTSMWHPWRRCSSRAGTSPSTTKLPAELSGRLGVAIAKRTYKAYRELLASERWQRLAAVGGTPQRLLWASTGTKDPSLPDTYYVHALASERDDQHDAREHAARVRRARERRRSPARRRRRRRGRAVPHRRRRGRRRRAGSEAADRRRRFVRRVVGRAALGVSPRRPTSSARPADRARWRDPTRAHADSDTHQRREGSAHATRDDRVGADGRGPGAPAPARRSRVRRLRRQRRRRQSARGPWAPTGAVVTGRLRVQAHEAPGGVGHGPSCVHRRHRDAARGRCSSPTTSSSTAATPTTATTSHAPPRSCRSKGIHYVDVGTSGGVFGLERGFCLDDRRRGRRSCSTSTRSSPPSRRASTPRPAPPVAPVAPAPAEHGYLHCGPNGAGHFVKMVHNGDRVRAHGRLRRGSRRSSTRRTSALGAAARADAETAPLEHPEYYQYDLDIPEVAEVWRRGSVIASWLLDLTALALHESPQLADFEGRVSDSGEGRWTVMAAIDESVPAHVITASLYERFSSRGEADFADKLLSAMRKEFGGHAEKRAVMTDAAADHSRRARLLRRDRRSRGQEDLPGALRDDQDGAASACP